MHKWIYWGNSHKLSAPYWECRAGPLFHDKDRKLHSCSWIWGTSVHQSWFLVQSLWLTLLYLPQYILHYLVFGRSVWLLSFMFLDCERKPENHENWLIGSITKIRFVICLLISLVKHKYMLLVSDMFQWTVLCESCGFQKKFRDLLVDSVRFVVGLSKKVKLTKWDKQTLVRNKNASVCHSFNYF